LPQLWQVAPSEAADFADACRRISGVRDPGTGFGDQALVAFAGTVSFGDGGACGAANVDTAEVRTCIGLAVNTKLLVLSFRGRLCALVFAVITFTELALWARDGRLLPSVRPLLRRATPLVIGSAALAFGAARSMRGDSVAGMHEYTAGPVESLIAGFRACGQPDGLRHTLPPGALRLRRTASPEARCPRSEHIFRASVPQSASSEQSEFTRWRNAPSWGCSFRSWASKLLRTAWSSLRNPPICSLRSTMAASVSTPSGADPAGFVEGSHEGLFVTLRGSLWQACWGCGCGCGCACGGSGHGCTREAGPGEAVPGPPWPCAQRAVTGSERYTDRRGPGTVPWAWRAWGPMTGAAGAGHLQEATARAVGAYTGSAPGTGTTGSRKGAAMCRQSAHGSAMR